MAEYRFCTVADEGRLRIVTINRPEVMNALHSEAHWEFDRVWNEFAAREDLWVGIITGAGNRAFSAGNDLKVQAAGRRGPRPTTGFAGLSHRFDLDKPLIAAVNGVAMGGGFETALACDIIIAAQNAVFALPEPRVGLIAGSGVHRLPRMIGQKAAMGMILTGRRVSAAEGQALGFVNEVVPEGEALPRQSAGRPHPRMLADGDPRLEASGVSQPRCTLPRSGDERDLPGRRGQSPKPGLYRRPQGLRRAPQAELAEPVAAGGCKRGAEERRPAGWRGCSRRLFHLLIQAKYSERPPTQPRPEGAAQHMAFD
jgi:enoyl-CoA hydratase/carnithine racemase